MPDDRPQWLEGIAREFGRRPGVEFAVVFGSRSDGAHRSASDIDVAVKFEEDLPSPERFRRLCSLSGDLQRSDAPFVDVSDIESLPLPVAARAVEGDLLSGDEASFRRYADTIETDYAERRDELRRHNRSVIDRIANGGLRGG